jgi:thioredoxin 1
MSSVIEITSAEFEDRILQSPTPALVDFDAEWCAPCRLLAPTLAELAEELEGRVAIFKVNVPANIDLATRLGITALPTVSFFQEGHEIARLVGLQNRERLQAQIEEFAKRATGSRVFMMNKSLEGCHHDCRSPHHH